MHALADRTVRTIVVALGAAMFCVAMDGPAKAECPLVDQKLIAAQASLRAAEPALDATTADFERRLGLIETAYEDTAAAETIRTTTPGGCGNIQQVYDGMMTEAWANLLFAYLKPSIDFYIADPSCRFISGLHTQSIVFLADETMYRSLIAWYPVDDRLSTTRDHITKLVTQTATYLKIELPPPDTAEDVARKDKFTFDVAKSRAPIDCAASVAEPNIPKPLLAAIFTPVK